MAIVRRVVVIAAIGFLGSTSAQANGRTRETAAALATIRAAPGLRAALTHAVEMRALHDIAERKAPLILLQHLKTNDLREVQRGGRLATMFVTPLIEQRSLWMTSARRLRIQVGDIQVQALDGGVGYSPTELELDVDLGQSGMADWALKFFPSHQPADVAANIESYLDEEPL